LSIDSVILGMVGYSELLQERFDDVAVLGIDRDTEALEFASQRLDVFRDRFTSFHGTYEEIPQALAAGGVDAADGYLFDLGVSSFSIDESVQGFAFFYTL